MSVLVTKIEMDSYNSFCIPQIVTLRFTSGANVKYQQVDEKTSITLSSRNATVDFIPKGNNLDEQKQSEIMSNNFIEKYSILFGSLDSWYKAVVQKAELLFTQIKVDIKKHAEQQEKRISQNWSSLSREMLDNYRRIKKNMDGRGEVLRWSLKGTQSISLNNTITDPFDDITANNVQTTILRKEEIIWLGEELRKGGWMFGERLFATSEYGNCVQCFHKKCDAKGATLTVVKIQGLVFGGFTVIPWSSTRGFIYGGETWLYKLEQDNYQRIEIKHDQRRYGVYHHRNIGPTFGYGHDLFILEDHRPSYCKKKSFSRGILSEEREQVFFKADEYEVFQVRSVLPRPIIV